MRKLNVGFVGIGGRGLGILNWVLAMDDVEVRVVCDQRPERLEAAMAVCREKYGRDVFGTLCHKEAVARDDIEAVVIPTSWNDHLKVARDAMNAGKYATFEVGPTQNVNECWEVVRTYERTGVPCMILENCCYGRYELTVLNMIKKGLLGEIVHVQGGYEHDLREHLVKGEMERKYHCMHRSAELYPTHELGPIMSYLNINRGNRMLTLSSMSSKARGLKHYIDANIGPDYYREKNMNPDNPFILGDIVTTMIRCAHGETIILTHDTTLPRPYSRGGRVQGTKGLWMEDNNSIYVDGRSPAHTWEPMDNYWEEYEHPLWRDYKKNPKGGHGGMDYLVMRGFLEAVRNKTAPPIDVYDSMSMIVVSSLSEDSIAMGGAPVAIPDFTDGKWIKRDPAPKSIFSLADVHDDLFDVDNLEI